MAKLATCTSLLYATAMTLAVGCATSPDDSSELSVEQASKGHTEIHPEDNCDPVTFGALCNPNFHGTTTRDAFNAELTATKRVAAWEYGGGDIRVSAGDSFAVDNKGGETHTFSVVANYGGGRNDALNQLGGYTVVAPECVNGPTPTNVDIPYLGSINVTTGSSGLLKPGTYKVQCCIHPWMRTTITVQ